MDGNSRKLEELSIIKTEQWSAEELAFYHRVMSDLSPWLNSQGNHIHNQIITEIEHRGGLTYHT